MADIKDRAREYIAEHSEYSEVFGQTFIAVDTLTAMVEFAEQELKEALKSKRCNCMTYLNFKDLEKENAELRKVAEFGYNKAKEWHEVEKGDLPKSSELSVIGILKDGKFAIGHSLIECYYSKKDGWSDCYGSSLYHEVEYWTEGNFPKKESE